MTRAEAILRCAIKQGLRAEQVDFDRRATTGELVWFLRGEGCYTIRSMREIVSMELVDDVLAQAREHGLTATAIYDEAHCTFTVEPRESLEVRMLKEATQ